MKKRKVYPPVNIGDTVYAVIDEFDGSTYVDAYVVRGIALIDGVWYVCNKDREFFEVGDDLCLLNLEEAQKRVAEYMDGV